MEQQFCRIMCVNKTTSAGTIQPIYLNHVREVCYGRCWDERPIEEYEICVHVEGTTVLYIGDQVYYPTKGTVATFRKGEVHKQFVTGSEPYERFILWLDYETVVSLFDAADETMLAMFQDREMFEKNIIQLPPHECGRLIATLTKAAQLRESDSPSKQALFVSAIFKALAIVQEAYLHQQNKNKVNSRSPIVSMALELVEKQHTELQSVDELARQLHISTSYLARIFKRQVGTSVYEYIQNMKLANSVRILTEGKTVTEACFESGFNNYSYFIQLFKRKYGITPHKYQKSLEL